ncbi:MAG: hypothetical protein PHY93_08380 [Bacteriovorax sp.]|nr:hypothetical protein [Bacteriovorax sp.]
MEPNKFISWTTLLVFSIFAIIIFAADIPTDDQIAKIITTKTESELAPTL